ncbi:hypothetical protein Pelo_160 [Pelomyxa schiedti]|nr:hypothetical protein Pelo_160 [Pelomyxa schiedti]
MSLVYYPHVIPRALAPPPIISKTPPRLLVPTLIYPAIADAASPSAAAAQVAAAANNTECGCVSPHAGDCQPSTCDPSPALDAYHRVLVCAGEALFPLRTVCLRALLDVLSRENFFPHEQALMSFARNGALAMAKALMAEWYRLAPPPSLAPSSVRVCSAAAAASACGDANADTIVLMPAPPPWCYSFGVTPSVAKAFVVNLLAASCQAGSVPFSEWVMSLHADMIPRADLVQIFKTAVAYPEILDLLWEEFSPSLTLKETFGNAGAAGTVLLQNIAITRINTVKWLLSHFDIPLLEIRKDPSFSSYFTQCAPRPDSAASLHWLIATFCTNRDVDESNLLSEALKCACRGGNVTSTEIIMSFLSAEAVRKLPKHDWDAKCIIWVCEKIGEPLPRSVFEKSCLLDNVPLVQSLAVMLAITPLEVRAERHRLLMLVLGSKKFQVAQWLLDYYGIMRGQAPYVLRLVCGAGNVDFAQWVTTRFNFSRRVVQNNKNRILRACCRDGLAPMVKWLVVQFALTIQDARSCDNGAFRACIESGQLPLVQWLTDHFNLTPDDARSRNNYALWVASWWNRLDIVKWLVERFNLTAEDVTQCKSGRSALYSVPIDTWLQEKLNMASGAQVAADYSLAFPTAVQVAGAQWAEISNSLLTNSGKMGDAQLSALLNGGYRPSVVKWLIQRTGLVERFAAATGEFQPVTQLILTSWHPSLDQPRWLVLRLGIQPGDPRIPVPTLLRGAVGNNNWGAMKWLCEWFTVPVEQVQAAIDQHARQFGSWNSKERQEFQQWYYQKMGVSPPSKCCLQ